MRDAGMIDRVRLWLEWPLDETHRLEALENVPRAATPFALPDDATARDVLRRMIVPPHAVEEMVAAMPTPSTHPEAWWLLERLYDALVDESGRAEPPWPAPQETGDPLTRYFHLYAFLAGVPHVLALHGARGIPEDVTFETLQDVGLQVAHYQTRKGLPGFDGAFWVWKHFRGNVFRLGRLQFDPSDKVVGAEPLLDVHIPAIGPLDPRACDDAFARAREFFAKHYPETPLRRAICRSWLMDDQLAGHLPESSNIVRFQRRFTSLPGFSKLGDDDLLLFVFGWIPDDLADLPQDTSMQRAAVEHLRDGRHWYIRDGVLEL